MKLVSTFTVLSSLCVLVSTAAFAAERPVTRVFKVDFKKANGSDGDTQQCDDTFYAYAELMIPAMRGIDAKAIVAQCPSMKPLRVEAVVEDGRAYTRVKLRGEWNCEYTIERPRREPTDPKSVYTISLSDGC